MEEAPENGKESLNSAHANGMSELINERTQISDFLTFHPVGASCSVQMDRHNGVNNHFLQFC